MSELKKLSPKECAQRLTSLKKVTVIMHARPDGDTVGSASALLKILKLLGADAQYACADKIPDRLAFLLQDEKETLDFADRELVAVDVASATQLGALAHLSEKICLTVDHHAFSTPFSDNLTIPDASSAGEVVFEVMDELIKMGKANITKEIAYPLYAAISSDTGGFLFSSASATTYRRAAELIGTGIDFSDVNHRLFHSKSKEQIQAEGFIASKLKTRADGKIAYATLSREERLNSGALQEHFETAIDVIRSLIFAEIALFVRENDDGTLKASIRSTGANVAEIAAQFGGGGHVRAAGCSPKADSAEAGAELLLTRLEELFAN